MSIERLFDAVERRGDIGWRVAALGLPISNRPRVTSRCAGKIGLREPGEHTSGPNLASGEMLLITRLYIRVWKRRHRAGTPIIRRPFLEARLSAKGGFRGGGGVINSFRCKVP